MSSIVERANAEADEAERENPDEEPSESAEPIDGPDKPDEEKTAAEAASAAAETLNKAESAEDKRHKNALAKIYGDEFDKYKDCPLCASMGYVGPLPPGGFPDELRPFVFAAMGDGADTQLKVAPEATMCPVCDGFGETLTTSKNPLHLTKICEPCGGKGWMNNLELTTYSNQRMERERTASLLANGPTLVPPVGGVKVEPYPDHAVPFIPAPGTPDQWNRPSGHPMWGSPNRADGSAI